MKIRTASTLSSILMVAYALTVIALPLQAQVRTPVIIEGKQTLPLRVLTRPFSSVYASPLESAAITKENLPAFQPLYVYTRPEVSDFEDDTRWYEVGTDDKGTVLGWMKSDDVMEWKQAMCLAYTHPDGRSPVLMFRGRDALGKILASDNDSRITQTDELYAQLDDRSFGDDFPVLSVEPKRAVFQFIEEQFYLMPILQFQSVEIDGLEGRLLQMAAATTAEGGRGKTTLQDQAFMDAALADTSTSSEKLRDLKIEVVYVIDTTASMQPYIDGTLQAMSNVAQEIAADSEISDNVRFGLWAFRDSMEIPGIEYLTRNYTPQLKDATEFAQILEGVEEAKVGSRGFPEDLFSGVNAALSDTEWNTDALRFIILVGDAPSHPKGHAWNASGKGAEELSQLARDARVSIAAIHIVDHEDTRKAPHNLLAEQQFATLATNRGSEASGAATYFPVDAADEQAFLSMSSTILSLFKDTLTAARKKGDVEEIFQNAGPIDDFADDVNVSSSQVAAATVRAEPVDEVTLMASGMIRAALVDWIGKAEGVQAPRDIVAWVVDKDLRDPFVPALEVRVLLNKNQLDSLRTVLMELMVAGRQGQLSGSGFFDALQATSATLSVTPEQIRSARTVADTGLIPEFLQDLPYKSRIMNMTSEDWNSWSQDQQDEFLNDLDAKISYYGALHDEPDVWVRLNEGDDPDAYVHPVSLEMLP